MIGIGFCESCVFQQFFLAELAVVDRRHFEDSHGHSPGLVQCDILCLGETFQIVGTLDENTLARGASDASEEGEGHADDQCTRTADHEEHEGTIEPCGERPA